ncbi:Alkyl hydroperoxide reductase subunit C-like protein [Halorubrum sp. DM2]|uniref:redoxin domain-containing protein n=1 Tax=Halorubrum sp. DM2 TaxID=2527867 RepID=UPI0024B6D34E|nr:peroxiredoxin [Halorubrum sp. DM2]VTT86385.1 Alkyl hydroperoxide reductase subunit C-like protein [Halorubrum sp. DM2]
MLQTGQTAPTFELPGAGGGRIDTHALTEYTDNGWAVVAVFYPFDFHPVCTTQMCTLRDSETLSLLENTVVLGISTDGVYSHRAFAKKHRIDFPLLADSDGRAAEAYGVRVDEIEDHRGVARSAVFVIDPDRTVQYAWRSEEPDDEADLEAVERAARCHGDECALPDGKSYL